MKIILYRKREAGFHQGLGTDTGKTYSKVDRNCCSSEVIQQPKSVKIILCVTITFVLMMPLDHFAALISCWGYTFAKAFLSGDSTQSKLTQLLQSHLRHSNQFITDPRAPILLILMWECKAYKRHLSPSLSLVKGTNPWFLWSVSSY